MLFSHLSKALSLIFVTASDSVFSDTGKKYCCAAHFWSGVYA